MAPTAANNTLQATILSTDINGNTSWNRDIGSPVLPGTYSEGVISATFPVGSTSFAGAAITNPIRNLYVKNNTPPGSGITVTVQVNINAGALQTRAVLQPGGVDVMWNIVNNVAASDITTVTLLVAGGAAQIEYFLGG